MMIHRCDICNREMPLPGQDVAKINGVPINKVHYWAIGESEAVDLSFNRPALLELCSHCSGFMAVELFELKKRIAKRNEEVGDNEIKRIIMRDTVL